MNVKMMRRLAVLLPLLVLILAAGALAQGKITTPKEFLGFDAGDDYMLANYTQLKGYWEKLAQETNRMKLVEIGKTAEGRPMIMAIFTSPENQKNLARYKEISRRLAHAEGLTDDQARKLAAEGKAVIWIDGGLHATECVPAQHLFHLAHQMASRTDAETMRILNDVILLVVPANPDGMELVSNWYMRNPDPKARSMNIPRLYQKYVGHDNNRDSYANNQPETAAISRQQFIEWFPHVVYNQHQTGPAGTVLFMAPFRDPFNYNFDPLVPQGIELVGAAIHTRFITEGQAGRGHARRRLVLHVVQRRRSDDDLLPQSDRPAQRDHRQPDADQHPVHPRAAAPERRPAVPDPAAAGVAPASVDRVPADGRPRHPGPRVEGPRGLPLPRLRDGAQLDRARQPGQLDDHAEEDRGRPGGHRQGRRRDGAGAGEPARPRWAAAGSAAAARRRSTTICCASRPSATRARSSCRPTSPTSSRPRGS